MTQEDKKLLLKDLSARLPYGVICHANEINIDGELIFVNKLYNIAALYYDNAIGKLESCPINDIRPYLRPLSSMTEEEKNELKKEHIKDEQLFTNCIKNHPERRGKVIPHFAADWCDKNMFAYHTIDGKDMFELGLALEAHEGMYNIKE